MLQYCSQKVKFPSAHFECIHTLSEFPQHKPMEQVFYHPFSLHAQEDQCL
jgi:hypothetical protein